MYAKHCSFRLLTLFIIQRMLNVEQIYSQPKNLNEAMRANTMGFYSRNEEEKYASRYHYDHHNSWKTRNIIQNQTSKTNVDNLKALEGYPYSSFVQPNDKNGKMVMVYKCDFHKCNKTFMRTWNLLDHIRMHYGVRPFVCKFCGKGFTQKGNMRKHLIQHEKPQLSNRKKFKCEYCNSSFTERYNYRTHLEKKHGIVQKNQKSSGASQNSYLYNP
ncbi:unnamed protein product [Moneuplotes crassus]|uniref:C2H2-type domain-containing protein n=2 Tax=Euplotes crassus TaxID=5936 RepID=A0AAD1U1P6_EUPCR|nr:unnamed protein product [Moneuplotes crassus]